IKDFLKRGTPTRPNPKVCHVQGKERQRLENLRKKQEAEEQRKKKVEEEKRRRQAEMKQKREERLRKAPQARERAEQMEEKKKKRMEQKIVQSDERVHISQVREEKVAEEQSKRKASKKHGEAETRKQKALRGTCPSYWWLTGVFLLLLQEEKEQQGLLQKRRDDDVKERGKKVLELKNLLEQQQLEQVKDRCELAPRLEQGIGRGHGEQRGKEKPLQGQLEPAALAVKATKVGWRMTSFPCLKGGRRSAAAGRREKTHPSSSTWDVAEQSRQGEPWPRHSPRVAPACWSLKGAEGPGSPVTDDNSYGLDLNSDDSTDDESNPRKPVPAWAEGTQLQGAVVHQYYNPPDLDALFGAIPTPKLEDIFYKSKPRYFKRTSSAVWHSPP
ncbi:INCEB protein, partial [Malurus elegans]|nr:INCEB protein [Malurus elegans]